jgi:hypothetical protein
MGSGLVMTSRAKVTAGFASAYVKAWKKDQGHSGSGGWGDRLVARQRPPQSYGGGEAVTGLGLQHREAAA